MSAHTPGPWTLGKHSDGLKEYKIHFKGQDLANQRSVACMIPKLEDARLMALAPELLEIVEFLDNFVREDADRVYLSAQVRDVDDDTTLADLVISVMNKLGRGK